MKYLSIALLLLTVAACREEEGVWDKLTQAEKDELQRRASSKCFSAEQKDIDDIIKESTSELEDYERLDTWEISTNASPPVVNKIHVWKKTATDVYFLYRQSDASGDFSKFIKVPIAQNAEQYRDLQRKKCALASTESSSEQRYTSASLSNSTFTGNYEEGRVIVDDDHYSIQTQSFTYQRAFPAFFGILQKTRVKKTYKDDTDVVTATDTYKWTIKRVADVSSLYENWQHSSFTTPRFCVSSFTPAVVGPTPKDIYYPIPITDAALKCVEEIAGPDADGNGTSDFAASELAPPFS